jgi:GH18 family chitinase
MQFKHLTIATLAVAATLWAGDGRVAGYFPYWLQYSQFTPDDVRYEFLTEIRYVSMVPSESGELALADDTDAPNLEKLAALADKNKVDLIISVGGAGNEDAMRGLGASDDAMSGFVSSAKETLDKYKADGIELDWVPEEKSDYETFKKIVKALSDGGVAVSANLNSDASNASSYGSEVFDALSSASIYFTDQMNEEVGSVAPNANLKQAKETMEAYVSAGLSANKLVPIIPMYGKSFYKAQGLGSKFEGVGSGNEGVLSYKDLMKAFDGPDYKVTFDEESWSEVAVSSTETVVFNGIPSFREFAKFIKEAGFGGVALYDLSGDHKEPIVSLLVTVGLVLRPDVNYQSQKKKSK